MVAERLALGGLDPLAGRPRALGEVRQQALELAACARGERPVEALLELLGAQAALGVGTAQPGGGVLAVTVGGPDLGTGDTLYRAHAPKRVLCPALELDRRSIERRDFPPARRGYDPDEVDRHLQAVAAEVEKLKAGANQQPTVAGAAATRVQAIVEAAERSAKEIEEHARADAQRSRAEAERAAREAREQADRQAAEHLERAQKMADGLAERADDLQSQTQQLLDQLGGAVGQVVDSLRGGAENIRSELTQMRHELGAVRDARVQVSDQPTAQFTPPDVEAEPEPEVAPATDEPAADAEPGPPDAEPAIIQDTVEAAEQAAAREPEAGGGGGRANEGARLIALNMALSGTPREETARYLADNFDLDDQDELLDEVYARAGG